MSVIDENDIAEYIQQFKLSAGWSLGVIDTDQAEQGMVTQQL